MKSTHTFKKLTVFENERENYSLSIRALESTDTYITTVRQIVPERKNMSNVCFKMVSKYLNRSADKYLLWRTENYWNGLLIFRKKLTCEARMKFYDGFLKNIKSYLLFLRSKLVMNHVYINLILKLYVDRLYES